MPCLPAPQQKKTSASCCEPLSWSFAVFSGDETPPGYIQRLKKKTMKSKGSPHEPIQRLLNVWLISEACTCAVAYAVAALLWYSEQSSKLKRLQPRRCCCGQWLVGWLVVCQRIFSLLLFFFSYVFFYSVLDDQLVSI